MVSLLLVACAPPPEVSPEPPSTPACWEPTRTDDLLPTEAGLVAVFTHTDRSCETYDGDLRHFALRGYDAEGRADYEKFDFGYDNRYDRRTVWASDACATTETLAYHRWGATGTTVTETTCVDGWPSLAVISTESDGEVATAYRAWAYTWADGWPATIVESSGASLDTLTLVDTETRDYLWDGRLTHVRTEAADGAWGETLYTWEDDLLLAESYVSTYTTRVTTWTYDAEGRVATRWSTEGEASTYVYVDGTRRIAGEYVDRGEDGVLDGEADVFVGYRWVAGGVD